MNIGAAIAKDFLKRTFFHPGTTKCEEQKREAREDYGNLFILFISETFFFLFIRGTMRTIISSLS
jgi:hypothetical protein